jgi:uncharacterized protein (DUF1697 family)
MPTHTQVVLLRGINLGPNNRIAMPALREALTNEGYGNVRTYVQSGNVLLDTDQDEAELTDRFTTLLRAQFDLKIPVVTRTGTDLAKVVTANPIPEATADPKRYQVSFCSGEPDPEAIARVDAARVDPERLVVIGREIYAWHPAGVARSKLWNALASKGLGVTATARNWTTVTTLLEMASA